MVEANFPSTSCCFIDFFLFCLFLKVWDMRKGTAIMDLKHHEDYISDITVDQAKRILLTAR